MLSITYKLSLTVFYSVIFSLINKTETMLKFQEINFRFRKFILNTKLNIIKILTVYNELCKKGVRMIIYLIVATYY